MDELFQHITSKIIKALTGTHEAMLLAALIVIMLMCFEIFINGYKMSSFKKLISSGASSKLDFLCTILVLSNISLIMGTILSFGILYYIGYCIKINLNLDILNYEKYPIIGYAIYIVLLDFTNYWVHRWMHKSPYLWLIHRFHHSATDMTMLNVLRDHPLERAILHSINAIPAAILGIPPMDYIIANIIFQLLGYLKHSNLKYDWGWFGKVIIQSPRHHRLHHSNENQFYNCNFASMLQFWDVLFCTSKNPSKNLNINIGLNDEVVSSNPFNEIIRTTKVFYETISKNFLLKIFSIFKK